MDRVEGGRSLGMNALLVVTEPADGSGDVGEGVAAPAVTTLVGLEGDPGSVLAEPIAGGLGEAHLDEVLGKVEDGTH